MKSRNIFIGAAIQILCCFESVWAMSDSERTLLTSFQTFQRCGISIETPLVKDAFDEYLHFDCRGSYKDASYGAVMNMSIQYPPDRMGGGCHIEFIISNINLYSKIAGKAGSVIRQDDKGKLILSQGMAFGNAGAAVITEINGPNWRGWIAEEINTKGFLRSEPYDWFTTKYRCFHLTIGNRKMTAQLDGVCLLRKRTYNLEEGFSYDVFMNMLKTLRFVED